MARECSLRLPPPVDGGLSYRLVYRSPRGCSEDHVQDQPREPQEPPEVRTPQRASPTRTRRPPTRSQPASPSSTRRCVEALLQHTPGRADGLVFEPESLCLAGAVPASPAAAAGCGAAVGLVLSHIGGVEVTSPREAAAELDQSVPGVVVLRFVAPDCSPRRGAGPVEDAPWASWWKVLARHGAVVRAEPSAAGEAIGVLPQGARVCVAEARRRYVRTVAPLLGWCAVSTSRGDTIIGPVSTVTACAPGRSAPSAASLSLEQVWRGKLLRRQAPAETGFDLLPTAALRPVVAHQKATRTALIQRQRIRQSRWPGQWKSRWSPEPQRQAPVVLLDPLEPKECEGTSLRESIEAARHRVRDRAELLRNTDRFIRGCPSWARLADPSYASSLATTIVRAQESSGGGIDGVLTLTWQCRSVWESLSLVRLCAERCTIARRFRTEPRLRLSPGDIEQSRAYLSKQALSGQRMSRSSGLLRERLLRYADQLLPAPADDGGLLELPQIDGLDPPDRGKAGEAAACGAAAVVLLMLFVPGVSLRAAQRLAAADAAAMRESGATPATSPRDRVADTLAGWCGFWCDTVEEAQQFLHCVTPFLPAAVRASRELFTDDGFTKEWRRQSDLRDRSLLEEQQRLRGQQERAMSRGDGKATAEANPAFRLTASQTSRVKTGLLRILGRGKKKKNRDLFFATVAAGLSAAVDGDLDCSGSLEVKSAGDLTKALESSKLPAIVEPGQQPPPEVETPTQPVQLEGQPAEASDPAEQAVAESERSPGVTVECYAQPVVEAPTPPPQGLVVDLRADQPAGVAEQGLEPSEDGGTQPDAPTVGGDGLPAETDAGIEMMAVDAPPCQLREPTGDLVIPSVLSVAVESEAGPHLPQTEDASEGVPADPYGDEPREEADSAAARASLLGGLDDPVIPSVLSEPVDDGTLVADTPVGTAAGSAGVPPVEETPTDVPEEAPPPAVTGTPPDVPAVRAEIPAEAASPSDEQTVTAEKPETAAPAVDAAAPPTTAVVSTPPELPATPAESPAEAPPTDVPAEMADAADAAPPSELADTAAALANPTPGCGGDDDASPQTQPATAKQTALQVAQTGRVLDSIRGLDAQSTPEIVADQPLTPADVVSLSPAPKPAQLAPRKDADSSLLKTIPEATSIVASSDAGGGGSSQRRIRRALSVSPLAAVGAMGGPGKRRKSEMRRSDVRKKSTRGSRMMSAVKNLHALKGLSAKRLESPKNANRDDGGDENSLMSPASQHSPDAFGGWEAAGSMPSLGSAMGLGRSAAAMRRRSSALSARRRQSKMSPTHGSPDPIRPQAVAESKVIAAFKSEELVWSEFAKYVVSIGGGMHTGTPGVVVCEMTGPALGVLMHRTYGVEWTKKDVATQNRLMSAAFTYANELSHIDRHRGWDSISNGYPQLVKVAPKQCTGCSFTHPKHGSPPDVDISFHTKGMGVAYRVAGHARPTVREVRLSLSRLALFFPDIDRRVTLPRNVPVKDIQELLGQLLFLFRASSVVHDIPTEFELFPRFDGNVYGSREIPHAVMMTVLELSCAPARAKLCLASRALSEVAVRPLGQVIRDFHPSREREWYRHMLELAVTPEHCAVIREEATPGTLRSPPKVVTVLAEVVCIVLGAGASGYWGKFRQMLNDAELHQKLSEFRPGSMDAACFAQALQVKEQTDAGYDRHNRQQPEHTRTSLCELTLAANLRCLVPIYRWVKALMEYYSRFAGEEVEAEDYGWTEPFGRHLFWN